MPNPSFLLELPGIRWSHTDARTVQCRTQGAVLDILTAADEYETWVYVMPQEMAGETMLQNPSAALSRLLGMDILPEFRVRVLTKLSCLGSANGGVKQTWRYVAQTDIRPEEEDEFNQWFDQEHLPGLAAIAGTEFACRYRTDGTPRYMACYDLAKREIHGSPEWKSAASTPWRDKVHRSFVNPRRMMFKRLA